MLTDVSALILIDHGIPRRPVEAGMQVLMLPSPLDAPFRTALLDRPREAFVLIFLINVVSVQDKSLRMHTRLNICQKNLRNKVKFGNNVVTPIHHV